MRFIKRSKSGMTSTIKRRRIVSRRRILLMQRNIVLFLLLFSIFAYLTNPFNRINVVRDPVSIMLESGYITPTYTGKLFLFDNAGARLLGNFKAGWHILTNHFSGGGKPSSATTLDGIIDDIHALRFNANVPFLISGDHFSVLYPRSLGIFYHSALDPRTARNQKDWSLRQQIYMKTLIYALETYERSKRLSTTIIPIGPRSVTITNYFDPPSDTMFSLLYAFRTLMSTKEITSINRFNTVDTPVYDLETTKAAESLLSEYRDVLRRHFQLYVTEVTDPSTGLVRKDISLSGTKDSVRRKSSFYDNVILWKTHQLAQELELVEKNDVFLDQLKSTILSTFWLPEHGYFLEELTDRAIHNRHYSSDWVIAYQTGFLDPRNENEQHYFTESIEFIKQQGLDRPFGLMYEPESQKATLHWILSVAAKKYGTQAIWSNFGMEYAKILTSLYQGNCDSAYLQEARYQIDKYTDNIVTYRGYPEVYNADGRPFQTPFYTSIHRTGWVVTYEQAKQMLEYTEKHTQRYCPTT